MTKEVQQGGLFIFGMMLMMLGVVIGIILQSVLSSCEEGSHLLKCISLQCEDYCLNEYNTTNYDVDENLVAKSVCSCYSVEGVKLNSVSLKEERKGYKGMECR